MARCAPVAGCPKLQPDAELALRVHGGKGAMATTTAGVSHGRANITPPPTRALAHIPGGNGLPLIGSTLQVLADPEGFYEALAKRHGSVLRVNVFGETGVQLLGPEANELVLFDTQRLFSAQFGWDRFLDR